MSFSNDEDHDALEAEWTLADIRKATGQLFRRPSSPKTFQSSQPFGSSSPAPLGNPFLLEDDIEEEEPKRDLVETIEDHQPEIPLYKYQSNGNVHARASSGRVVHIRKRKRLRGYTEYIPEIDDDHASRTRHYGIPIHHLLSEAEALASLEIARPPAVYDTALKVSQESMWVDKYRPKKFTELLGDERTNRDVMRWIRHWDYCVFGRTVQQKSLKSVQNQKEAQNPPEIEKDPHDRPERKILMLTGPPGFGKTTLAHIAARQAGYNVIEVNASDDRTGSVVQNKIGDALESQAVFNPRPSLVVIDEIDGVSTSGGEAGFIRSLLKFLTDDEKTTAQNRTSRHGEPSTKKRGKKKTSKALLRPIICICNDQYVAALRPLRQYCQIINFRPLSVPTVVARLARICRIEGMQADARALNALCEIAESDLRSCVNSLQYVRMKSTSFTLDSVATTLAKKDMSRSSHSVVEAVFKLPDAKKERKKGNLSTSAMKDNIVRVAELAMTNNEFSKILNGCFAQYPLSPYHDSLFSKPVEACDWLFFHDRCERGIYENQHSELLNYMPYSIAAFHHLFATHESPRTLERSKADWEAREKIRINNEILAAWINGVKASIRQTFTPHTFASELLSYGMRIIGTNLNPANAHLVKASDRAVLSRVVDAMFVLGLHYNQFRVDDGSYIFRLDPPLPQVLNYEGVLELKGESLLPSRYAARQIISSELAAEKIRRSLESQGQEEASFPKSLKKDAVSVQGTKRQALEELSAQPAVKRDFFGRPIQMSKEDSILSIGSAKVPEKQKAGVHIKFSDGFSDAVRNNISIKELLSR
ncbi:Chromosome transmission fidelity protein [Taphrina deformans PYCC 5710]|uniref:Chromosome transmission fidelity protein n=1 Tax=Taphrina deformans (strain PYCC 5710 / ATCC 11124 / CBS 356.35 / IMI 108563 / JCM 9778 / NBRC 8474) TaxID=1097556 RepID=R4XGI1_TAPDE|nr:Chromosome transmission fidelity protein [Taphrina deformans PYCC 5710]|eukprot:CCG83606.1 Chromosome transmission fidelity protein [Taphrina deformans PYCC 5710]